MAVEVSDVVEVACPVSVVVVSVGISVIVGDTTAAVEVSVVEDGIVAPALSVA